MAAQRIAALLLLNALCGCLADPGHCDVADPGCAAGSDSTQSEIERQLPAEDELSVQLLQKKAKKQMTSSDINQAAARKSAPSDAEALMLCGGYSPEDTPTEESMLAGEDECTEAQKNYLGLESHHVTLSQLLFRALGECCLYTAGYPGGADFCKSSAQLELADKNYVAYPFRCKFCRHLIEMRRAVLDYHQYHGSTNASDEQQSNCMDNFYATSDFTPDPSLLSVRETHSEHCFPNQAEVKVQLQDGTWSMRFMAELQIGDTVLTGSGSSKVIAFTTRMPNVISDQYVQLKTAAGFELTATQAHYVFAHAGKVPVLVKSIVEGDLLWIAAGNGTDFVSSRVTSVVHKEDHGLHVPITEDATIVVNGVLASCHGLLENLHWDGQVLFTGHDAIRYLYQPMKIACRLRSSLCGPEWHDAKGQHLWIAFLEKKLFWLPAMNHFHHDLKTAFWTEPSMNSCISGFVQVLGAALLFAVFSEGMWYAAAVVGVLAAAKATCSSASMCTSSKISQIPEADATMHAQ